VTYVVTATWYAKEGEEERVAELLATNAALSELEPGCRMFIGHRSVDDPRMFLLYEQYDDEAAFKAHTETAHFRDLVLGDVVPRLERRERAFYTPIDTTSD
jgi:quinol monooxygenase YgiN